MCRWVSACWCRIHLSCDGLAADQGCKLNRPGKRLNVGVKLSRPACIFALYITPRQILSLPKTLAGSPVQKFPIGVGATEKSIAPSFYLFFAREDVPPFVCISLFAFR